MQRFWSQPLLRQLLLAVVLLLVPLLGAAMWSGKRAFDERVADVREEAAVACTTTAAYLDRYLSTLDLLAAALVLLPAVQSADPAAAAGVLERTRSQEPTLVDVELIRVEDARVSADARIVSVLEPERAGGAAGVRVAYPVKDGNGSLVASLGLRIALSRIQEMFERFPLPEGSVVTLTDRDGVILARTAGAARYVGSAVSPTPRRLQDIPASEEIVGVDGVRRIHANAIVPGGPWVISVGIPKDVALTKSAALWSRSFALLLVALVGWVAIAIVLSRRFVRSVGHLETAAQRVAAGDLRPLEPMPMPSAELSQLQDAFHLMVQRLDEARQALDRQVADERRLSEELQSLQRQVIRQERLAAVGMLVSGVAHEINNPLQAILGFAELLQMQHRLPESVTGDLKLIQKESARACGIIRNLALFARQQPGQAAPVRLGDIISSVAELRQRRLESEDIELVVEDQSSQPVMAVFTELQQVVLNFVVNAEQAIVTSGRLPGRITIRARDTGARTTIEVEDTGPGVPPADEPKLFQPFFTTKPVGQGTGLGLSVSYGIIDSMGGTMGYRRAPVGGAIFYFELPACAETVDQ